MSRYVHNNGRMLWYIRAVPLHMRAFENRSHIKISLKTTDSAEAGRKADYITQHLESLWDESLKRERGVDQESYARLASIAKLYNFTYKTMHELSTGCLNDIVDRVKAADDAQGQIAHAILGSAAVSMPALSETIALYSSLCRDEVIAKNEAEKKRWLAPRIRAINNLIAVIGNKKIDMIARPDLLKFREHWLDRMTNEGMTANSANKDFIHARTVLSKVCDAYHPEINIGQIFTKITIKENNEQRASFDVKYIQETLLNREVLKGLNEEAFLFLCAMADTGARVKEITGLLPDDIVLDARVPHIIIRKNAVRELKNKPSERTLPLVGSALYAFKKLPTGFSKYLGKNDLLSNTINKFLREHDLLPSEKHSLYSLRHSFKDRMIAAEFPDRLQKDLMGHSLGGPRYGRGATLEHCQEWLEKIAFTPPRASPKT